MSRKYFFVFLLVSMLGRPLGAEVVFPSDVGQDRFGTEILWQAFKRLPQSQRPRIVVVLGGGGARGLAHIGVLRVFEQEGVPVDEIIGVSVGALIGSLYASGLASDQIESMAEQIGWNHLTNYSRYNVLKLLVSTSLFSTEKMETYLEKYIGRKEIQELKIPFMCVATDLRTGERVVFREGPAALASRASATIPGLFRPVSFRQRQLVDGGVVDNLPTDLAQGRSGAVFVIGVLPESSSVIGEYNSTFLAMARSLEIQKDTIINVKKELADFLIQPDVRNISVIDLSKSSECIEAGMIETRKKALALKKAILARALEIK